MKQAEAQEYIGSQQCINCHAGSHGEIVTEYQKSGHPYKLNPVSGGPPTYPENTTVGPMLPPGTAWDDFQYVVGGYGWKARFVKPDGRVYTVGDSAQYNLPNEALGREDSWAAYHKGEDKKYDFSCFQCHTTGPSEEGSWNGVADDSLGTFEEPGIRCEGCHGPGSDHQAGAFQNPPVLPPNQGDYLRIGRCGECHQRGGATNAIPVSGGYIRHHEQLNEMRASKHGNGVGPELTCANCHNPHAPLRYEESAAAPGADPAIAVQCQNCHPNREIMYNGAPKGVDCVDCHMPMASKSAVGMQLGNGWQGDVRTHIWAINTNAATKDEEMFTPDGSQVALDGEGLAAVTLDFVCLQCHTNETVGWANAHADGIHTNGIVTGVDHSEDVPAEFALQQNYPNPFNPTTTIAFALPRAELVRLTVYNVLGQTIGRLVDARMPAGEHTVQIDASSLASGLYFYEIRAGEFTETRSMTLQK
jgi:hypothetical protein